MATRGTIALEFADKTVGMVYSHWDNYPSYNGKILQEHYMDPFKVRQLIDLGNVSSLAPEIGVQHDFDGPSDGMTTFYGRDRGDTGQSATYFKDFADYKANGDWQEYNYILRNMDGKPTWFVNGHILTSVLTEGMEDDE